jgi:hypothetical protein
LAANPWLDRHFVAATVIPVRQNDLWYLADETRNAVKAHATGERLLTLAAVAGGRPTAVFGEWTREGVLPMSAWHDGRMVAL